MRQSIFTIEAIKSLRPNGIFSIERNDFSTLQWHEKNDLPPPTLEEVLAEEERLKDEYNAVYYREQRAPEYPSIGDQLDALFHAGVFPPEMAEKIQAVKDKYPK